jgi:hypothetical protein
MPFAEADSADKISVSIAKKCNERLRNSNALKTAFFLDAGTLVLDLRKSLISSHIERVVRQTRLANVRHLKNALLISLANIHFST